MNTEGQLYTKPSAIQIAEGRLYKKDCPGTMADASMTDTGQRPLELHMKGDYYRPSLVSGLSSHSQALYLAEVSFLRGFLQWRRMGVRQFKL